MNDYEGIVTHFASPTLVLAGPGAGKTYLLADRIKRLLNDGVNKNTITVLTFGKDAQRHMKEELLKPDGAFKIPWDNLPVVSTMHSLREKGDGFIFASPHFIGCSKTAPLTSVVGLK